MTTLDVQRILNYYFYGGDKPFPIQAADVNCDDQINLADVIDLINYVNGSLPFLCCSIDMIPASDHLFRMD